MCATKSRGREERNCGSCRNYHRSCGRRVLRIHSLDEQFHEQLDLHDDRIDGQFHFNDLVDFDLLADQLIFHAFLFEHLFDLRFDFQHILN